MSDLVSLGARPSPAAASGGAARKVFVHTFGCQMNDSDSERMVELLGRHAYARAASPDEADLILLNTCAVREKAEQKLLSALGRYREVKARRGALIAVSGCVAQQEKEKAQQAEKQARAARAEADLQRDAARQAQEEEARQRKTAEDAKAEAVVQLHRMLVAEQQARTVSTFLEDMLVSVTPEQAKGRDTTLMRELLEKAAVRGRSSETIRMRNLLGLNLLTRAAGPPLPAASSIQTKV